VRLSGGSKMSRDRAVSSVTHNVEQCKHRHLTPPVFQCSQTQHAAYNKHQYDQRSNPNILPHPPPSHTHTRASQREPTCAMRWSASARCSSVCVLPARSSAASPWTCSDAATLPSRSNSRLRRAEHEDGLPELCVAQLGCFPAGTGLFPPPWELMISDED
jgi:hypothetical protein